ncbi:MAG: CTP synthetase [Salinigranum sp.]
MKALVSGPDDRGLGDALAALGVETIRIEGPATRDSLAEAGLADADLFVLTDMSDASAIPVAKDRNPDVRVVAYSTDSLPEFARGQADLAVDPDLLGPDVVAEELAA